jgi:hypothetical protein
MTTFRFATIFTAALMLNVALPSRAATFCVADAPALAVALNIADNNGQSDEILLQAGTFTGNFIYNANAAETGDLTIRGGYDPACVSTSDNPADTVIDGGNSGRAFVISGRDNSDLVLRSVTIRNGLGQTTGAGADIDRWISVQISNNVFTQNNTAAGLDGSAGMEIDRSLNVVVEGNVFSQNNGGKGGGMALSDMDNGHVTRNRFSGNTATFGGGGLDVSTAGLIVIANNLFDGNHSAEDGGAVDVNVESLGAPSQLRATNNTFVGNTAGAGSDGGGMDIKLTNDPSTASLHNNVFWNNSAGRGNDLSIDNDDDRNGIASAVAIEFNDFNQAFFVGFWSRLAISIPLTNFNAVDPLFVNAAAGDFHLSAASPLIDAGDSGAPDVGATDLDGGARIVGASVDLGSFEVPAAIDSDGDGVVDTLDNCTQVANADQRDTNGDGFGNRCDADLNNDGIINSTDLGLLRLVFFSTDPDADFNGDGVVNATDLGQMRASFFQAPGPSGLAP